MTSPLLSCALAAEAAGLSVVAPRQDGSKAPDGGWERWQRERPNRDLLARWYENGRTGLGFVCGHVSGGLELLEFEDDATYRGFKARARAVGLGPLVERIEAGYLERSPGGGWHWLTRCSEIGATRSWPAGRSGPTRSVTPRTTYRC